MAGVIKAGSPESKSPSSASKPYFHLEDLEERGNQYLNEIRQQAAKIIADAHAEAEQIRQQTIEKSRHEAIDLARQQLDGELQRKLTAVEPMLQTTIAQLRQQIQLWQREWENRTVSLAIGVAEKVVGQQLKNAPEIVLTQLEQALKLAGKQDRLEVRIHPNDMEEFKVTVEKIIEHFGDLSTTVMVPDSNVERGGCIVRSKYGDIDTQLSTQIQRIGEELS